jgi:hypothetical protein
MVFQAMSVDKWKRNSIYIINHTHKITSIYASNIIPACKLLYSLKMKS